MKKVDVSEGFDRSTKQDQKASDDVWRDPNSYDLDEDGAFDPREYPEPEA